MSSITKSIGCEKVVHGITVKKLPIGAYMSALEELGKLPATMLEKLYPEKSGVNALMTLRSIGSKEDMLKVLFRLFAVMPREITLFFAKLLDVDYEKLISELTPNELMEVVEEFFELNDLGNFIKKVKALVMALKQ